METIAAPQIYLLRVDDIIEDKEDWMFDQAMV